ncbi:MULTISPECIES: multicopper oxidase domain-containing protein [Ignavibacterium]|jgi:FtsP/CotA-like multicopper oxidase with cupredoxin domain|uniref:multicopper oxidase domain-containing protein n=1 Tax=Ignavibacterium TaxID=795750 RepID=UPI0025C1187E|nr:MULTISPECIES: multicopper oxidase domain-containing protein [Ignavibacterium]MBI5661556.1 multicopper oxidase domain-containing protein [Ignavibacterium album]
MKRREFIIKSASAGFFLSASRIFPAMINTQNPQVVNALRFPPVLQPGENLVLRTTNVEVWPGTTTEVIALNNSYPSPTIIVNRGDNFSVNFENQHSEEATIHWHGLLVPEMMDGHPKDAVMPGGSYTYTFPVYQRAGTYFYHSHAHNLTAKHVYKGFAGFFIVNDEDEISLGLPSGEFDVPLLIQDRRSVNQPQFTYQPNMMDVMIGYLGNLPLVNGTPDAFFDVQKTLYRFRILNGSNARVYKLGLSDNRNFWLIATDSGLKDHPAQINNFFLAPGERADILIDFSNYTVGESVVLKSLPFSGTGGTYPQGLEMNVLIFNIIGNGSSNGVVPDNLSTIEYYDINDIRRTRNFTLTRIMTGSNMHRINGLTFDINRIDEIIIKDELEEWKFINNTNEYHPIHIHGVMFQVYSRNGNTSLPPNDKGWKDTVLVNPNETVSVLVKFVDYSGTYLLHCHNLEHEDDGMMINIRIDNPTDVNDEITSPGNFELYQNYPNPFNPTTKISYRLNTSSGKVSLSIYDVNGTLIEKIFEGQQSAGEYSFVWNASDYSSGTYFLKMNVDGIFKTIKLIYLK